MELILNMLAKATATEIFKLSIQKLSSRAAR